MDSGAAKAWHSGYLQPLLPLWRTIDSLPVAVTHIFWRLLRIAAIESDEANGYHGHPCIEQISVLSHQYRACTSAKSSLFSSHILLTDFDRKGDSMNEITKKNPNTYLIPHDKVVKVRNAARMGPMHLACASHGLSVGLAIA